MAGVGRLAAVHTIAGIREAGTRLAVKWTVLVLVRIGALAEFTAAFVRVLSQGAQVNALVIGRVIANHAGARLVDALTRLAPVRAGDIVVVVETLPLLAGPGTLVPA
jgi:hypothetical protein